MTHITSYPTKKAFREAVLADPDKVWLEDPSIIEPCSGSVTTCVNHSGDVFVTNHPWRSWFAHIYRKADGALKVD